MGGSRGAVPWEEGSETLEARGEKCGVCRGVCSWCSLGEESSANGAKTRAPGREQGTRGAPARGKEVLDAGGGHSEGAGVLGEPGGGAHTAGAACRNHPEENDFREHLL